MAYGFAENPALSITPHLDSADFPTTREDLALLAEDGGAPVEVINLFKSLPRARYESKRDVLRDLTEASRRMATGRSRDDGELHDRRNIGRDRVEDNPGKAGRHP
jgi:hypothetical protein